MSSRSDSTFDPKTHIARVITNDGSQKAVNAERNNVGVLSQVDGARWLSSKGEPRQPRPRRHPAMPNCATHSGTGSRGENPTRVVIEVHIESVLVVQPC